MGSVVFSRVLIDWRQVTNIGVVASVMRVREV